MSELLTEAQLEALRQIDTPTIANAIEPFNIRSNTDGFMGYDIRCMYPEMGVMVGYAVTATLDTTTHGRMQNRENMYQFFEAIRDTANPAVVVLKDMSSKPGHGCHWGDGLTTVAMKLGAIGLVSDGGIRDVDTVREMGFQYYAPGMVPAHGNFGFLESQLPVRVSDVLVNPGDIIHADANGVVCIPISAVDDIIAESHRVLDREKTYRDWVNSDDFSVDKLRQG
jgi:regulator of RNase E activity RraA